MFCMVTAQKKKPSTENLKAAWKAGEEAVEFMDFEHIRRTDVPTLPDGIEVSPLAIKEDLIEDVMTAIMTAAQVDRFVAWKIAKALVTSEWNKAEESDEKKS